ncbi:hypothetical protein ILUMI_22865 [Ignelater luminosus]|uniref:Uncharacterized protein n=1 Tax=Ignelater luminosus TaxID=2038154 RepID=A0A8K0FX75_IGNLU|nr:hypothetical protein ILUMI_22865 [Ignelater luminosus]
MSDGSDYFKDVPKLPKEVSRDGAKWLMVTSKIILDTCCVWPEKQNNLSRLIHLWYILSYIVFSFGQLYCISDKNSDPGTIAYAISLFIVTIEVVMPSAFGIAFTYFVGHMSELLIYCYMGNEVMLQVSTKKE